MAEVVAVGLQRVHEGPANSGGIRPEGWRDSFWQPPRDVVEGFEDPAAGPIQIGAIVENDVNERKPEERIATHDLGVRDREHLGGERVGDLVLHDLRRLSGIFGVDDHLDVGKIRDRVERRVQHRIESGGDQEGRAQENQELVVDRPLNDSCKHGFFLVLVLRHLLRSARGTRRHGFLPVGGRSLGKHGLNGLFQIAFRVDEELRRGHDRFAGPNTLANFAMAVA